MQPHSFRAFRVFAILALAAVSAGAQPVRLTIDLGGIEPNAERTFPVEPGTYVVEIVNKAPASTYKVTVAKSFREIPALPSLGAGAGGGCLELRVASGQLRNTTDEREVAQLVPQVRALLGLCDDQAIRNEAQAALDATHETVPGNHVLELGQQLKVTISTTVANATKTWTVLYQTPDRGRWVSSYGFTFIPATGDRYFAKAKTGEAGKFVITEKKDRLDADFAPSVFFSWFPTRDEGRDWSFSWTAGLGFDTSNPVVFAGPMWTFNQNIAALFGLVIHKEKRLSGEFRKGDEVTTNLTEAQLHEETYTPTAFVGLSFRFGANPFPTSSTGSGSGGGSSSGGTSSGGSSSGGTSSGGSSSGGTSSGSGNQGAVSPL